MCMKFALHATRTTVPIFCFSTFSRPPETPRVRCTRHELLESDSHMIFYDTIRPWTGYMAQIDGAVAGLGANTGCGRGARSRPHDLLPSAADI